MKALLVQTSSVYDVVEQVTAKGRQRRSGGTAGSTRSRMGSSVEGIKARPEGNFLPAHGKIGRRIVLHPRKLELLLACFGIDVQMVFHNFGLDDHVAQELQ